MQTGIKQMKNIQKELPMKSLTKNSQNKQTIEQMVKKYFPLHTMEYYKELTEGYFSTAYEIFLSSGKSVILKIAPSKEVRVMTCEKNIMSVEVESMKLAKENTDIPVPDVLGYDNSCTICKSPYFFMEKLDGKSLNEVKSTLSPEQFAAIYAETGRILKKVNEISCPRFGYPGQPEFQSSEWYRVFHKMLEAGIHDAQNGNVDLKISIDLLWDYLEKDKCIFEEVTEPKLVHWDCWDGNIFVKNGVVTGIIDWERSLWADPLMEVNFRTYSDNSLFLKGYGINALTASRQRRALWYDIYALILMSLECEYRKYETMDMYNWSNGLLQEQFKKL